MRDLDKGREGQGTVLAPKGLRGQDKEEGCRIYLITPPALEPAAFNRHWGITQESAIPGGLASAGMEKPRGEHKISMLKRSSTPFGNTLGRTTGWVRRAELQRNGVIMIKGIEYRRIDDAGVHIAVEGTESVLPAHTVVLCAGQEPKRELKADHYIGGAKEAGELDAKRAMLEGAELAARL